MSQRTSAPRLQWLLVMVGLLGAAGVGMGAFSAHGLENVLAGRGLADELLAKRLGQAEVGVRYHLVHVAVLVGLVALADRLRPRGFWIAAWLFLIGIVLFSGSLYVLVLTNTPALGAVTPFGGVSLMAAWLVLAFSWRPLE